MKSALEDEIAKAQSQFERARKRNLELKSAVDGEPRHRPTEEQRKEDESQMQSAAICSQSPSPPPFLEKEQSPPPFLEKEQSPASPELFEQEDDSFRDQSFSPEPGLIEHLHSPASEKSEDQPQEKPQPPAPEAPEYRTAYQPPFYAPGQMYAQPPFYYPTPYMQQGGFAQMGPQTAFPQSQFDMQGYARQMVDFFKQFLPPETSRPRSDAEYRQLEQALAESTRQVAHLQKLSRSSPTYNDSRMQELTEELEALQRRYMETEEELIQTQRERDKAVALVASGHYESANDLVEELQMRLEGSMQKVESLEKSLSRESDLRTSAERRLEISKNRTQKLETDNEELRTELRCLHEEHTATTRDLTTQLKKAQKDCEIYRTEVNLLRSEKDKLVHERAELTSELRSQSVSASLEFFPSSKEPIQRRATVSHETRPALTDPLLSTLEFSRSQEDTDAPQLGNKPREEIRFIETELMNLQIEKDLAMVEFNKIPEHSKTASQRRRREELERELEQFTSQINSLKRKLRTLTVKKP